MLNGREETGPVRMTAATVAAFPIDWALVARLM
jgi:hypothetical protein